MRNLIHFTPDSLSLSLSLLSLSLSFCCCRFGVEESGSGVQLKTLADLDRETASSYTMTLIAQDGGEPPLADSVRIEVTVEDENDIAPVFSVSDYHISLFEGDAYPSFVTFHVSSQTSKPGW